MPDVEEYYRPGVWNIYCMSCLKKVKSDKIRKRWDGMLVCEEDWEPRHPQDFLRAVVEKSNILPYSYDTDGYITPTTPGVGPACTLANSVSIAGVGVAGCMVAGVVTPQYGG